jgi:ribosomal-protein-alanine N-acetyltransferase
MIEIREFRTDDVDRVSEIVQGTLGEFYPRSLYLEKQRNWNEGFMVGVDDGVIMAMIMGVLEGRAESRVLMLAVNAPYRNHGIGYRLMSEFIKKSVMRGVGRITLEVRKSNISALRFYGRFGFQISGVLPMYYSDMEDGFRMVKIL